MLGNGAILLAAFAMSLGPLLYMCELEHSPWLCSLKARMATDQCKSTVMCTTAFLHAPRPHACPEVPMRAYPTAAFSEKARHEFPRNMILMGVFTVGEGILVGAATSRYQTDIVLLALGITAAVTFSLMTFALTTKNDFTTMGSYLYAALLSLFVAGLVGMVLRTPLLTLAISTGGAALFSM